VFGDREVQRVWFCCGRSEKIGPMVVKTLMEQGRKEGGRRLLLLPGLLLTSS